MLAMLVPSAQLLLEKLDSCYPEQVKSVCSHPIFGQYNALFGMLLAMSVNLTGHSVIKRPFCWLA